MTLVGYFIIMFWGQIILNQLGGHLENWQLWFCWGLITCDRLGAIIRELKREEK